jgi:hypothetical protein
LSDLNGARNAEIRAIVYSEEELITEVGTGVNGSIRKATATAVVTNPWVNDPTGSELSTEVESIAPVLATRLTDRLLRSLGGAGAIKAFGKAAVIGTSGELEHGAAFIHTPYFGNLVREFLEGTSIICFADERAEAGTSITVPLWHKTEAATRDFYQTMTARVADGPRPDEILVIAGASTGPRPLPRLGDRKTDRPVSSHQLAGVTS